MKVLFILKCPFLHVFAYAILNTFFVLTLCFSVFYKYKLKARSGIEDKLGNRLSKDVCSHIFEGIVLFLSFILLRLIMYFH